MEVEVPCRLEIGTECVGMTSGSGVSPFEPEVTSVGVLVDEECSGESLPLVGPCEDLSVGWIVKALTCATCA